MASSTAMTPALVRQKLASMKTKLAVQGMKNILKLGSHNETADAHFIFTEYDQKKQISAHKSILAAASPVFMAMFYGPLKEKGEVKMVDESMIAFKVFLKAIYHNFEVINMENISDVMSLADKYDARIVMDYCTEFLTLNIDVDNICFILSLALTYRLIYLKVRCKFRINWDSSNVLKSKSFMEADLSTLECIMQINRPSWNQKEVFDACVKWAQKSCERKSIDDTPDNLRAELGPCFAYIKFDCMTQSEFIKCERSCPFFTFGEYKNIISNFTCHTDD